MINRLEGKIVIVAGASRGIGEVTARRLASESASVVVAGPPSEEAAVNAVVADITAQGGRALAALFDATDDASFAALCDLTVATFGGIDAFHANFADQTILLEDSTIVDTSDAVMDRTLDVNLKGMARATRHAIPHLLARGGGSLIYSSSAAATMGQPVRPYYAMAKAGIGALVRHVASAWGRQNIRANAILPGYIVTPMMRDHAPAELLTQFQSETSARRPLSDIKPLFSNHKTGH